MFRGYLKTRDHCEFCGEEFFHHRADDGPAYLTMLVVGLVAVPVMYFVFVTYSLDPFVMSGIFCVASVLMALYLLPKLKGVLIAIQWAHGMRGFR